LNQIEVAPHLFCDDWAVFDGFLDFAVGYFGESKDFWFFALKEIDEELGLGE